MEVDPPNVTANPDKFQKLISFGQKVFDSIVNQSKSSERSIIELNHPVANSDFYA